MTIFTGCVDLFPQCIPSGPARQCAQAYSLTGYDQTRRITVMSATSCDVVVIGAGLSGLTAAGLLAKSGLSVLVLERTYMPGGACGAFRRKGVTFDMGAAMLFGFGERGFNPHRFVMNELEEPIEVIRHRALYRLNYGEHPIVFWPERERYYQELDKVFPGHTKEIRTFSSYIADLYENVIAAASST